MSEAIIQRLIDRFVAFERDVTAQLVGLPGRLAGLEAGLRQGEQRGVDQAAEIAELRKQVLSLEGRYVALQNRQRGEPGPPGRQGPPGPDGRPGPPGPEGGTIVIRERSIVG